VAAVIHLDTHVVVWLFLGRLDLLSEKARAAIDGNDVCISPMVRLETCYLAEIGRLTVAGDTVIDELKRAIGLQISSASFAETVDRALEQTWTRDPFDRLIAAQALVENAPLLTRDRSIRDHCELAIWD